MTVRFRRVIIFILLVFIVALCVALPTIETIARDLSHINNINVVDMEPIRLDNDDNTSLVKRISLISDKMYKGETKTLGFESGSKFTINTAIENAISQLDILYEMGLLPENSKAYTHSEDDLQQIFIGGIEFAVDNDDPSSNLILWDIEATSNKYLLTLNIDDETGKILMFKVRSQDVLDWADEIDFYNASKLWAEYLQVDIKDNTKILYGNRARIYLQMNDNIFLYSESYNLNDIDEYIPKVLRMNLYDEKEQVQYVLYHDLYEFGIVVE